MPPIMTNATHNAADDHQEIEEFFNGGKPAFISSTRGSSFIKSLPPPFARRESLLTRQLHASEGDSHTEDERPRMRSVVRGLSASSNPSVASTAELTDDNEVTSPGTRASTPSPTLPPVRLHTMVPVLEKPLLEEPRIVGDEEHTQTPAKSSEKEVEAGLGRRRCITFACGRKSTSPPPKAEITKTQPQPEKAVEEPPKRKCALTFACPSRTITQAPPPDQKTKTPRHGSPAPRIAAARSPRSPTVTRTTDKAHRGSDSTIKNDSPKAARKSPLAHRRKYSVDADDNHLEARRFHEFGTTENVEEEWVQESTCHRSRLTIKDTLQKENVIRQLGEEVEEEALEDDEQADDDEDEILDDDDDDDDDEVDEMEDLDVEDEEDAISDAGFDTDDEEGFARSDDDGDDSDNEWWAPGRSTAATSADHLDLIRPTHRRTSSESSLESARGANGLPEKSQPKIKRKAHPMKINRPVTPDLPDSTDFVCGTLDEDRPLEQAYINCMEQKKAAKHKVTPQDIDPTFPTSDPEMDEEDEEEDEDENFDEPESDQLFMHGDLDLNNEDRTGRRSRVASGASKKRSPRQSPRRLRSPPPPTHRVSHRSPPPPTKKHVHRSPLPDQTRKHRAKSPAPGRCLFGQSPRRIRSPAPMLRIRSPNNSRRTSIEGTPSQKVPPISNTLGQRPQPTHTASLPRTATLTNLRDADENSQHDENDENDSTDFRTRGAIDIVKGLEKKRQRRKEKLYQKHCQKAHKQADRKPKPGKGAERMREVGLELAAYKGKKEHMLSY